MAALIAAATSAPLWLGAAAIAGSFGRGGNGATGPFSPIEQAWLAAELPPTRIVRVFRLNAAVGFFGMSTGAGLAMLPIFVATALPGPLAYRPIFAFAQAASAICFALLSTVDDPRRAALRPLPRPSGVARRRAAFSAS